MSLHDGAAAFVRLAPASRKPGIVWAALSFDGSGNATVLSRSHREVEVISRTGGTYRLSIPRGCLFLPVAPPAMTGAAVPTPSLAFADPAAGLVDVTWIDASTPPTSTTATLVLVELTGDPFVPPADDPGASPVSYLPNDGAWLTAEHGGDLASDSPALLDTLTAQLGGVTITGATNKPRLDRAPSRLQFNVTTNAAPNSTMASVATLPAALVDPEKAYVSLWKRLEDTPADMWVLGMGQSGTTRRLFLRLSATQGLRTLWYNPAQSQVLVDLPIATVPLKRDRWQRWEVLYDGAGSPRLRMWADGQLVFSGAGPDNTLYSGTDCGLTVGNVASAITTQAAFKGSIEGVVLSSSRLPTDNERALIGVATDPRRRVLQGQPDQGVRVLLFGNSWLFGRGATQPPVPPPTGPGAVLEVLLGRGQPYRYSIRNAAESGASTRELARVHYPRVATHRAQGQRNVAVVLEMHNDAVSTGDPNDLHLWVQQLCTRLRDDGWHVVVCTAVPSVAHPPSNPSDVVIQANALVRAQWPNYAHALVDLATVPEWQTPGVGSNPAEYSDNTHLTPQGYARMALYLQTGIIAAATQAVGSFA